jgi:hypothetical protein
MKDKITTIEGLINGLLKGPQGPFVDGAIGGLKTAHDNLRWHMERAAAAKAIDQQLAEISGMKK